MLQVFKDKLYSLSVNNKFFIFSICIIILIIIFHFYSNYDVKSKFINYISNRGYVNTDGSNLYYNNIGGISLDEFNDDIKNKDNSYYEINYFDVDEMIFKKNRRDYIDGMESNLNLSYSYKTKNINYSYRAVLDEESTLIYTGEYLFSKGKYKFTCNKDYVYQFDDNNSLICDKLKEDVINFYDEAINVIDNYSLVNRMIK